MAITKLDSFQHYSSNEILANKLFVYQYLDSGVTLTIESAISPSGEPGLRFTVPSYGKVGYGALHPAGSPSSIKHGFRFKPSFLGPEGGGGAFCPGFCLIEYVTLSKGINCMIYVTLTGQIAIYRTTSSVWGTHFGKNWNIYDPELVAISQFANIVAGNWYDLIVEMSIGHTAAYKVYINGGKIIDGTGDTQFATITDISTIRIGMGNYSTATQTLELCDFRLGDENTGDCRVDAYFPDADGTDSDWDRSSGDDDYPLLDDLIPDTDTYIETDTINDKTSVNLEALKYIGGIIKGVQGVCYAKKLQAGICELKMYLLINGSRYYSDPFYPSYGSYQYFTYVWSQNPDAGPGAWTEAAFNSTQIGIERTA